MNLRALIKKPLQVNERFPWNNTQGLKSATFETVGKGSEEFVVLACSHASNFIPDGYNNLGLDEHVLRDHVAFDPGAAEFTRELADYGYTGVLGTVSRAFVELGRKFLPGEVPELFVPFLTGDIVVPGNLLVMQTPEDLKFRARFHQGFHQAVVDEIVRRQNDPNSYRKPFLLEVHTCTYLALNGVPRDFAITFICKGKTKPDSPFVARFMENIDAALKRVKDPEKVFTLKYPINWKNPVRLNQPYDYNLMKDKIVLTSYEDMIEGGLDGVVMEVRNDLATDPLARRLLVDIINLALVRTEAEMAYDRSRMLGPKRGRVSSPPGLLAQAVP